MPEYHVLFSVVAGSKEKAIEEIQLRLDHGGDPDKIITAPYSPFDLLKEAYDSIDFQSNKRSELEAKIRSYLAKASLLPR